MMDFMEWCDHNDLQLDNLPGEDLASYVEGLSLSGHSLRLGRALDLLNEGESLPEIMLR